MRTATGDYKKITEPCDTDTQRWRVTTKYETKNNYISSKDIVLTFYREGFGTTGKTYIKTTSNYFAVNGHAYNHKVDGNNRVLAYYTDTTISQIDSSLSDLYLESAEKQQYDSSTKNPIEWTRGILIHFEDSRDDGPTGVHFVLDSDNPDQYLLKGVDSTMEYRMQGTKNWTPCTDDEMSFEVQYSDRIYEIRYSATADKSESKYVTITLTGRRTAPEISINWVDESFNKPAVTADLEYSFDGSEYAPADNLLENGVSDLLDQITVAGPLKLHFRYAATTEIPASRITPINLYPRSPQPENITVNSNTYIVSGVSSSLQYFVEGDTGWRSIGSTTTLNLREFAKGDTEVCVKFRTKSTSTTLPSRPYILYLPKLAPAPNTLRVDYANEKIVGFQSGLTYQYRLGTGKWYNITLNNLEYAISGFIVTNGDRPLSIRVAGTDTVQATDAWNTTLPKRIAAPTTCVFTYNDESYVGKAVLTGVSPEMEYQMKGATVWTPINSTQQIFDLPTSGITYYFRVKSTDSSFASLSRAVTLYAPASAPNYSLNMTTELIPIAATMEYRIDNSGYVMLPSGQTTLPVTEYINALSGTNTTNVTFRYAATATRPASKEKTITLVARRDAPTTVTYNASNQYINGTTSAMQYREVGTTNWYNISKTTFSVASVLNGRTDVVLEFRYKPTSALVGSYSQRVNCF